MDIRILRMVHDWEKYLSSIYYDANHPGSFSGPETLYKIVQTEGQYKIGR